MCAESKVVPAAIATKVWLVKGGPLDGRYFGTTDPIHDDPEFFVSMLGSCGGPLWHVLHSVDGVRRKNTLITAIEIPLHAADAACMAVSPAIGDPPSLNRG